MINSVVLTGRLTADPELKTTTSGISVISFSIAVDRAYKSGDNKQTDFINIVAWRNTAEFISKYFTKGSAIGIEGSIQTRKYEDKNGNSRVAVEVVANQVHFIERKRNGAQEDTDIDDKPNLAEMNTTYYNGDEDLPF